jgi:protein-disulfide isomerase
MYTIVGGIIAALLVALLAAFLITQDDGNGSDSPPVVAVNPGITAPIEGRVAGDPAATVQVVEWGDYQCPACARFEQEAVPVLIEEYVNTGKITFEFRDFAFLGPESTRAAEATMCADDQGKFWEMHSTIFANHSGENQGAYSDDRLKEMAEAVGLDMDEFEPCFEDETHADAVADMYEEGTAMGVNSTPTLFINGERVQYAGIDDLRAQLDAAIGG